MYKPLTLLLFLTAGLVLGWTAHERWGARPVQQTESGFPTVISLQDNEQPVTAPGQDSVEPVDSVARLLQDGAYAAAVERYESLQALADEVGMQQSREAILSYVQQRIQAQDFAAATQLLQGFLLASYRDADARLLLAEVYYGQQDYQAAIEQLYKARGDAFRPEMLTRITRRIRLVVNAQAEQFRKSEDTGALLDLFQNLTQQEPDYAAYFVELAIAQLALDDREAARRSLELVMYDAGVGEQAQAMLLTLQQAATVMPDPNSSAVATEVAGIPLTRRGQHFLVDVHPGDDGRLRLLIDTGASMTIVTPAALQQQGVAYRDTGRTRVFNTANGPVRASIYVIEMLSVGDWYIRDLEVGVLELGGQADMDGLLGMNFLSHFRFFIDQNESLLRLSLN
jgi:clan AA aspartic protease (TIGR02281 family)